MFDLVLHAVEGESEGGFMDIVLDTLLDGVKLIPFLFIAFLIIELIEHKLSKKTEKAIAKAGKGGPIIGALLGGIPQCGFSVVATNLYITRIISLGTLISIYLSTSDEMIPVLLSFPWVLGGRCPPFHSLFCQLGYCSLLFLHCI